jgi:formiminotetrahydrofolate cyclodeaminase
MTTKAQVFEELIAKILGKEVELQEVRRNDIQAALEKGERTPESRNQVMADGRN